MQRILLLLLAFLAGCAAEPLYNGKYEQLGEVPPSFLAAYPNGSQAREIQSVQAIFDKRQHDFYELYHARLWQGREESGQMDIAVALQPNGSVEAVALISSELQDPEFEKAVLQEVTLLQFGAATGEGLFVFWYPLKFTQ